MGFLFGLVSSDVVGSGTGTLKKFGAGSNELFSNESVALGRHGSRLIDSRLLTQYSFRAPVLDPSTPGDGPRNTGLIHSRRFVRRLARL